MESSGAPSRKQKVLRDGKAFIGTFFLLSVTTLSVFVFIMTFSGMGFGAVVYAFILDHSAFTDLVMIGGGLVAFLLYMFDFSHWDTRGLILVKRFFVSLDAVCLLLTVVLLYGRYPSAPLGLFLLVNPGIIWFLRSTVYKETDSAAFFKRLGFCFLLTTSVIFTIWVMWVVNGHWWNDALDIKYSALMRCDVEQNCLVAYLLWISPMIYCMAGVFFAMISIYISFTLKNRSIFDGEGAVSSVPLSKNKRRIRTAIRIFMTLVMVSLLGMWIAASIAGAQMRLANIVMTFAGMSIVVMGFVMVGSLGWESLRAEIEEIPFVRKIFRSFLSDWVKAMFLLTSAPIFCVYMLLSVVNQFIRRRTRCGRSAKEKFDANREKGLWLTYAAHNHLERMKQWRWSSVLVKVVWLGVFYVTINIGVGKATTLFLSWLNVKLEAFPLHFTTIVFMIVGLTMFLLPPVPGVPVYLTGGILLTNAGEKQFGFIGAVMFACVICFVIKLMAIAVQQKGIGQNMSGNLAVRRFVSVNSITIRAIRIILQKPGLPADKVFILIGGPDWPTSVLTGILRLQLRQMLLGSLPVVFLIVPSVCASAFLLKINVNAIWGAVASVTLALAALVQTGALVLAGYYIEEVADKRHSELVAIPDDEEVLRADKRAEKKAEVYQQQTNWHADEFPAVMKLILILSALLMIACVYIIQIFSSNCFIPYALTDSIEVTLGGNAWNIIQPMGYVAIELFLGSFVLLYVFRFWASRRMKKAIKARPELLEIE